MEAPSFKESVPVGQNLTTTKIESIIESALPKLSSMEQSIAMPPELAYAILNKEPINVWVVQTMPSEDKELLSETTFTSLKIIPLALHPTETPITEEPTYTMLKNVPRSVWSWEMPPETASDEKPTYATLKTVPLSAGSWEERPAYNSFLNSCSWSSSFSDDEEASVAGESMQRSNAAFQLVGSDLGIKTSSSDGDLRPELKEEIALDYILDLSEDPAEDSWNTGTASHFFDCGRSSDINSRSSFDDGSCQKIPTPLDSQPNVSAAVPARKCVQEHFVCTQCNKEFDDQLNFKYHKRLHKSRKPYTCDKCNQKFAREKTLERHKMTHDVPAPLRVLGCPVCGEGFTQKAVLKAHLKEHTRNKPFACRECGKCFKTRRSLELHTMLHENVMPFTCDICNKQFALEIRLKYHQVTHYERQYKCHICAITLATKHSLRRHLFIHSGKKPFCCKTCGKSFAFELYLRNHLKKHFQLKAFPCDSCGKAFGSKTELENHAVIHKEPSPYRCTVCDKSFKGKYYFKVHMKIHSDEKPFVCDICGERFQLKYQIKSHMHIHFA